MNSPFAYQAPCWKRADCAEPVGDALVVDYGGQKCPALEFFYLIFGFRATDLLIEGVEELLSCGGPGKRGAVIERAAEAPEIEQAFRRAIEHDAHAIEEIDDGGGGFAHSFYERLIGEKIAAVNCVVKMFPGGIAFAF